MKMCDFRDTIVSTIKWLRTLRHTHQQRRVIISSPQPKPTEGVKRVFPILRAWLIVRGEGKIVSQVAGRREYGIRQYGTELMTHNGRDVIEDLRQEALDALQYAVAAKLEGASEEDLREITGILDRVLDVMQDPTLSPSTEEPDDHTAS